MTATDASRFIKALKGQPHDRTPIWVMRQAGRYLPEYRRVRASVDGFMALCQTPELACEVTLQPIQRYGFDAAVLFSDILTIPNAMGLPLQFYSGVGPVFEQTVRSMADVRNLGSSGVMEALHYVFTTVTMVRRELDQQIPLIGFSGSPWTLATYMVEGQGSKQFLIIRKMRYQAPEVLKALLDKVRVQVTEYLCAQIEAGADVVQLFDTWGGVLTPGDYEVFSLDYMRRIIQAVQARYPHVPCILFTKGGGGWLSGMLDSGAQALGVDWTTSLYKARQAVGEQVTLQGNLDPAALYGSADEVAAGVRQVLASYGEGFRHIFNLGHGILPDTDPENVAALVEAVRQYGKKPQPCTL